MHAKEIIKNKADKMVDLIIDEIGTEGQKKLTASFVDEKKDTKYIIKLSIESGSPDIIDIPIEDEEDIESRIQNILERLVSLEIKEDKDTVYDDTNVLDRILALEQRQDSDTVYDDSGIKARLRLLENEVFPDDG